MNVKFRMKYIIPDTAKWDVLNIATVEVNKLMLQVKLLNKNFIK